MFDHVSVPEMRCPGCGADLGFQTKDYSNSLDTVTVPQVMAEAQKPDDHGHHAMRMLGGCEGCRWWIEVKIQAGNDPVDIDALVRRMRGQQPTEDGGVV